jgi:dihydroorotate dehydrogenase
LLFFRLSTATVVKEAGGLSGQPLKPLALQLTKDMYKLTNGTVPIIGVGGISNGEDAYERIKAGASLVQVYTALSYEGPGLGANISNELAELMKRDGITSVRDVVGKDVRA